MAEIGSNSQRQREAKAGPEEEEEAAEVTTYYSYFIPNVSREI